MVSKSTPNIEAMNVTPSAAAATPNVVYQPPKLKEIVEIIDLMGHVATRVREDNAGDWTGATATASGSGTQQDGSSARSQAIARAPSIPVMQKELIRHLEKEMRMIRKQAKAVSSSRGRGSAYLLNELYKKLRRLRELARQILGASAEVIKRFYISVFIDRQPLVVRGGSLNAVEE
ncbi:MAG: hypothetical protein ABL890_04120 [Candidatus Peribacteraceae bacterium]